MNVYDFDETIFYPDSSFWFIRSVLNKRPLLYLIWLPTVAFYGVLYFLRLVKKEKFKEALFSCVKYVDDIDAELEKYWNDNEHRVAKWYLEHKKSDDLIISASPEFVVKPMADRLGVKLIASNMDKHTGKYSGLNCRGEEKVRRFYEQYPDGVINEFYSDSYADTPLARLAQQAFMVVDKAQRPVPWKFK